MGRELRRGAVSGEEESPGISGNSMAKDLGRRRKQSGRGEGGGEGERLLSSLRPFANGVVVTHGRAASRYHLAGLLLGRDDSFFSFSLQPTHSPKRRQEE
ncbi:hypothetical protein B296_00037918 [Ensete ventricosum]|uniref:Uncharacterized protein n=1 Tax=Ensete ventricosum TaxID=4639 RepID=A0A426YN72_ENSVE|nr:hypothetical protein B296_00037918 [Ensete ventricosum]